MFAFFSAEKIRRFDELKLNSNNYNGSLDDNRKHKSQ